MTQTTQDQEIVQAFSRIPSGLFVMTAAFENKRTGVIAKSVQHCAEEPPLLCVAIRKGHWIEPIIRDSHYFGLCVVNRSDRLLQRRFSSPAFTREYDPFDGLPVSRLISGAPILDRAAIGFDCEVVRHFDLEADHELYIGQVLAVRTGTERAAAR